MYMQGQIKCAYAKYGLTTTHVILFLSYLIITV